MSLDSSRARALVCALVLPLCAQLGCLEQKPRALLKSTIPAGFTFQTTRSVEVSVDADAALLSASGGAALELARADGKRLYSGFLRAGQPVRVRLALATKDDRITAVLHGSSGDKTTSLDVRGATAAVTFR